MPEHYEIRIKGHLDQYWSDWFAGLQLTNLEGDETLISVNCNCSSTQFSDGDKGEQNE
jgi:hypothetical protein